MSKESFILDEELIELEDRFNDVMNGGIKPILVKPLSQLPDEKSNGEHSFAFNNDYLWIPDYNDHAKEHFDVPTAMTDINARGVISWESGPRFGNDYPHAMRYAIDVERSNNTYVINMLMAIKEIELRKHAEVSLAAERLKLETMLEYATQAGFRREMVGTLTSYIESMGFTMSMLGKDKNGSTD